MDFSSLDRTFGYTIAIYTIPFLIGVSRGRNMWLTVLFYSYLISGLIWTCVPHVMFANELKVAADKYLWTFGKMYGGVLFFQATLAYHARLTGDKAVLSSLFLTQFIGIILHIVADLHIISTDPDRWNANVFLSGLYGLTLLAFGSLLFYFPLRSSGGRTQLPSKLNTLLRFNGVLILLNGIVGYGYPDVFVKLFFGSGSFENHHLLFIRVFSGETVTLGLLNLLAPGFLFEADKKGVAKAQIVAFASAMFAVLYYAIFYEGFRENPTNVASLLLLDGLLVASAVGTIYAPPETTADYTQIKSE